MNFNIKVVLAQNYPLSSDFIYNTAIYDYKLFSNSDSFQLCNGNQNFHLISKIYDEAGRDLFDRNNQEINSIPDSIIRPPINISSFTFRGKLGQFTKNLMTMFSIHSPFNCSFDSLSPLVYFWNTSQVFDNWIKMTQLMSRIPCFVQLNHLNFITNFRYLFIDRTNALMHTIFVPAAVFGNGLPIPPNRYQEYNNFIQAVREYQVRFNNNHERQIDDVEFNNQVYKVQYNDGRFIGNTGPLASDWYFNSNIDMRSAYNTVSLLKTLFDFCLLGSFFNEKKTITLPNAAMFISYKTGAGGEGLKFTAKYYTNVPENVLNLNSTQLITQYIYNRVAADQRTRQDIERTTQFTFVNMPINNFTRIYNVIDELGVIQQHPLAAYSLRNLYRGLLGSEEYHKIHFALFFSGLFGHIWDYVLRYFDPIIPPHLIELDVATLKLTKNEFSFVQHIGSVLGSYIFDYKTLPEKNILLGYNINNLSKCMNFGLCSLKDNVNYNTTYYASNHPVGLFPICYQNLDFYVDIHCWKSYKSLLNYMNTRQKRYLVLDNLNHYGRRAMTVLDPYGIFMHFHDESRGIQPSN